ncbi:hypothetical protein Bcep22_gp40 [Burkholderia phage Bcep22]|uniref:Uncharacterized protein n=1 Tax=Burkholderia phage Bcep22 TaxID=2883944 RepID=Q6V7Q3_9CAUD|nr:hypothetical protein Bcep22_gp40 [Burkholderia phage Bcep22]AAQ54973.1 hypothetical protein Bcep22_gp40 [Burkholderia phage Bcep22]
MLHFHDTLCKANELAVRHECGFRVEFIDAAGYCIDAIPNPPAGSTQRFDPDPGDLFHPFAAPRFAYRF